MLFNNIGTKRVSLLGFGGIPIMSGKTSEFLVELKDVGYAESLKVIEHAVDMGINFFDTAVDYGDSEDKIGEVLSSVREKMFIASKSKALYRDEMLRSVEKSLKALKTDYIDLYQFHYVKDKFSYDTIMGSGGSYSALVELKRENVIRHIGLASHNQFVIKESITDGILDTVQLPYNIIENESKELIDTAANINLPVIVMKPYAGGSLTKINNKIADIIEDDKKLRKLALNFIIEQPVTVIIPGMSSIAEIDENIKIIEETIFLSQEEKCTINILKDRIGSAFCRRCQYCEPCPRNIPIAQILRINKYYEDYGLEEWAKEQYINLKYKADRCIECKDCENKCPYELSIVSEIKNIHEKMGE